jgi:hypothetical protein
MLLNFNQAIEVCKLLGKVGDVLARKLLIYDALAGECARTHSYYVHYLHFPH